MVTKEKLQELNAAMDALRPNIYLLSMFVGKIDVPSDKKLNVNNAVEYIAKYYEIERAYKNAGISRELSSDLEYEERSLLWRIEFSESWNNAVSLVKRAFATQKNVSKQGTKIVIHAKESDFKVSSKLLGGAYCHFEPIDLFPEETCSNPIFLKEQKEAIQYAVDRKFESRQKERPNEQDYYHIFDLLFECERFLIDFENNNDFDGLTDAFAQVIEWMRINIGYGEHVGSFRMLEYAEELGEKIEDMFFEDISIAEINLLAHNIKHLIFRIAAYYGEKYEEICKRYDEYDIFDDLDNEFE